MKNAMTTTEHLNLIVQHLDKLLATAEKRSRGAWEVKPQEEDKDYLRIRGAAVGCRFKIADVLQPVPFGECPSEDRLTHANAAFIASCAGNAEAGWRATRATVRSVLEMIEWAENDDRRLPKLTDGVLKQAVEIAAPILAAFPLELITTEKP